MNIKYLKGQVLAEYRALLGRVVEVNVVSGFVGEEQLVAYELSSPALVQVVDTPEDELLAMVEEGWIDPTYRVRLAAPHEELAAVSSLYICGTSRCIDGRTRQGDICDLREPCSMH